MILLQEGFKHLRLPYAALYLQNENQRAHTLFTHLLLRCAARAQRCRVKPRAPQPTLLHLISRRSGLMPRNHGRIRTL